MSVFDSIWDRASKILDRNVDGVLGDRLRYRHRGQWLGEAAGPGLDPVIPGFVDFIRAPENIDAIDETLGNRKRVKISKDLVDEPLQSDRIQHPKLGEGWFRPAGSQPEEDGRYWLFDVQGASAP